MGSLAPTTDALSNCPKCNVALESFEVESSIEIGLCHECKGMWLRKGQLSQLANLPADFMEMHPSLLPSEVNATFCPDCKDMALRTLWYRADIGPEIDWCSQCDGIWLDRSELEAIKAQRSLAPAAKTLPKTDDETDEASETEDLGDSLAVLAGAIPASALLVPICKFLFLPAYFLDFFYMQFHEVGHATAAWLGSSFAVPLFYGETVWFDNKSVAVYIFTTIAAVSFGTFGYKSKTYFLPTIAALFMVVQLYCTLFLNHSRLEAFRIWDGVGGQFWIPTVLIIAYFYKMPSVVRWDFWRYPALIVSMYTLIESYYLWSKIDHGKLAMPVGSLLGGRDDRGGDIDRLVGIYHWDPFDLSHAFVTLGRLCFAVIAAHYLFFLFRKLRSRSPVIARSEAPKQSSDE